MRTVLVVEDEPIVMNVFCLALTRAGYRVLEAATAAKAFLRSTETGRQIDLLLADVVLPVSSGIRVALQMKQAMPGLKVLLTSGYPMELWGDQDRAEFGELPSGSVAILQKPFPSAILIKSVCELIGPATKNPSNYNTAAAG